ncbi:hypothetical protein [Rathayibacter tanaceti]|uniref:Uncharacterized protein n=2 Tax=Rathayibacter tanaceti TaxID=1671680 RepID=A0A162J2P2_9MICO|nr:hypothetical protein [Rathayibacter tanaceti]KZX21317.1 hypothetical protein ACH61_01550 [Rathayibacter tanaceti]QHC54280.1 hypothetical protein GSU10_00470 [Rathayibacter tanaceti]TCO37958.1 hypothetical protein EV639_103145 [Rathayibacter tanaceti]
MTAPAHVVRAGEGWILPADGDSAARVVVPGPVWTRDGVEVLAMDMQDEEARDGSAPQESLLPPPLHPESVS